MSERERSVEHTTLVIERSYPAAPERVFAAWADPEAKVRWFGEGAEQFELEFRVGGRERHHGRLPDGTVYAFEGRYQDIVDDQRIVYTYEMLIDGVRISVSVATVELHPDTGGGTRLVLTEQGAFLDGRETPDRRKQGTGSLLDALGAELERETRAD
jgi:uncharacterized protein YndB with AHSA1/START domain